MANNLGPEGEVLRDDIHVELSQGDIVEKFDVDDAVRHQGEGEGEGEGRGRIRGR